MKRRDPYNRYLQNSWCIKTLLNLAHLTLGLHPSFGQTLISIDKTITFQQIDGWEAVSNPLEASTVRDSLLPHLNALMDLAIHDVGITRLRYSYKSGMEDTVDYFTRLINEEITYDEYKQHRYYKINDNDDPFSADLDGFQMSGFRDNLDKLIVPFKNKVEANGEDFYFNLCFVDFVDQSPFHHTSDPEEYAEYMAYAWHFMDSLYGFTPDGLEVILEPDNADVWSPAHIPAALAATGDRLLDMGYSPEFIAPSLKSLLGIPNWLDDIVAHPKALDYLDVISYHRYGGNTDLVAQQQIVDLADQYGKKTSMLEYDYNGDVDGLHYDLKHNQNTAWTKYALMYKSDEKFAYVFVDDADPQNPFYGICKQTKYLRQYFKFIRPQAIRIEATTTNDLLDPIAFVNHTGNQVVVIKAEEGDSIVIHGLQADEYGIKYTLGNYNWGGVQPTHYDIDLPNQQIADGEAIAFTLPNKGVVTIYGLKKEVTSTSHPENPSSIYIYPNPAQTYLTVSRTRNEDLPYQITTSEGLPYMQGILFAGENQINIASFPCGVYFITMEEETIRFVKM